MGKKVLTAYERAFEDGDLKGELRGVFTTRLETARNMKSLGFSIEIIQKSVGLSEDELKENGIV